MSKLLESIGLQNTPVNELYARSAVEWINKHTTLKVDPECNTDLSAAVQLFILKYTQLLTINSGIASESISGLSQSFTTGQSLESKIYELATAVLGKDCLLSTVTVHAGESKWDYGC